MNISKTISDLRWRVTRARVAGRKEYHDWRTANPGASDVERNAQARNLGEQYAIEIDDCERQIRALEAPIVSMVVTNDNRVLVATQYCVFELKDDKLVFLTFERNL